MSHQHNPVAADLIEPMAAATLSEAVLAPQATDAIKVETSMSLDQENEPLMHEHHEALIGNTYKKPETIVKQPTVATLGSTPFEEEGHEIEHHKVIATEVVKDPVQFDEPEPVLQNALVLLDPRLHDCTHLVEAAMKRGLMITAIIPKPNDGTKLAAFYPTAEDLLEAGIHQVYEPPYGSKFDIVECATHLKTIEVQQNLRFLGVIPCREAAVDFSDTLGALLGLAHVNDLGLASARRDKGLMKWAVANAGLRVAKYARLTRSDGKDVIEAIQELELEYPVVVKTPRGMSTMDVYICSDLDEAIARAGQILTSIGPDGRKTQYVLLEEFIKGEEFAVNLCASPTTPRGVQVTDIWQYHKINTDGAMVNTWQSMVDPHDRAYASLVRYAEGVCRAVGIQYGMAHVELKAEFSTKLGRWVNPAMIEVGARMAGGRKSILATATVPGWNAFDAVVDAHCGFPVRVPPSFSPKQQATHVFIPSDKNGILKSMKGHDFERLSTYCGHIFTRQVGQEVVRSTDLMSFVASVWLIGDRKEVEMDAQRARDEFQVQVVVSPDEKQAISGGVQ